ncbi:50S ribosomal protein L32 [uncultured Williamsia sp.]|jgi:large subunit ribosomal protein L32|uniref:50S ribosomal protein L32 n=1 Tax=uncultured Williamsia sp. TaxID=259311 RepID=UPI00261EDF67|nr:50S ribosomal protein L32 [uncultured Williamsia sp.]
MAVPKRRMSRANSRSRRAQWKADNPALQEVKAGGVSQRVPRRLVKAVQMGIIDLDRR